MLLLLLDLNAARVGVQLQDRAATVECAIGVSLTRSPTLFGLDLQFGEIGIDAALLAGVDQRLHRDRKSGRKQDADVADGSLNARFRDAARLSHELGRDASRTRAGVHPAPQSAELDVAAAGLRAHRPFGRSQGDAAAAGLNTGRAADVADGQVAAAAFRTQRTPDFFHLNSAAASLDVGVLRA